MARSGLSGSALFNARSTKGTNDLLALSKRLKAAGETGLRKELHKVVRDAAKPLIPLVKEAARTELPSTGGMNEHYARKRYRAQTRTGQKNAGVSIVGPKTDPRVDAEGRVAHPVFGRPDSTVVQKVPGAQGFFSKTLAAAGPSVRDDVVTALTEFTNRVTKGG